MEDGVFESETLIRPRQVEGGDVEEREREKRQKLVEEVGEIEIEKVIVDEEAISISTPSNGGGGILDNLISKLSSPRAPKVIDVEVFDVNSPDEIPVSGGGGGGDSGEVGGGDGGEGGTGGGGNMFNNLMSNFFQQNEGEVGKDGEEKKEDSEIITKKGTEQESEGASITNGNGNGNIFANLVPDHVSTGADEASILIHSVVHD